MFISAENRFLYVKTSKTAGTSLEIALSKYAGPKDIITAIEPDDEALRTKLGFRGPQNHFEPGRNKYLFWNHIGIANIRARVAPKTMDKLTSFSVSRNPFTRAVSGYYWKGGPKNTMISGRS